MTIDVTGSIVDWSACCLKVWNGWFVDLENGEDEFIDVADALLCALVLSRCEFTSGMTVESGLRHLVAVAVRSSGAERSICHQGRGGILCRSHRMDVTEGDEFGIRGIDPLGRLLNDEPCVELAIGEGRFVLEPLGNLRVGIVVEA